MWIALASVVAFAVATWLHLLYWGRRLTLGLPYAELHRIATDDGSAIELRRIASPSSALPPVLLVHGVGANHRNLDLDDRSSLARHLARAGRDVWLVTLRCGRTRHAWRERPVLHFAAMVAHDLPVAVREVRARTGSATLDYVGFSMGGMLLYAALTRTVDPSVLRRVAIIGSPARVAPPLRWLRIFAFWPMALVPRLPFRALAHLFAFLIEWVRTPLHDVVTDLRNLPRGATRLALWNMIEDVPARLSADFARWGLGDGDIRVAGERGVDHLRALRIPARFIAGAADKLGMPDAVAHGFAMWGADVPDVEKDFRVLGRATGHTYDYAHGDLCIGTDVATAVNEPVAEFLARASRDVAAI